MSGLVAYLGNREGHCSPVGGFCCDNTACRADQICCDGRGCAPIGTTCCGDVFCYPADVCFLGRGCFRKVGSRCGDSVCRSNEKCCFSGDRCVPGTRPAAPYTTQMMSGDAVSTSMLRCVSYISRCPNLSPTDLAAGQSYESSWTLCNFDVSCQRMSV
jgi:hypothetical protein